jgi:hypothetical protein
MQYWGDHFLAPLCDMLAEACNQRSIPDCEFFLNKKDYPQLPYRLFYCMEEVVFFASSVLMEAL